ncbi:MAG TPA: peroxiredoxin [Lachnospiraceae bacterium]|nr:peroxiredoxin [Lachnospiraceae bacterium]
MDDRCEGCLKIGQIAPDFSAQSTYGPVSLSDYKGKWLVFFSHPGDFTPVCTTEFVAFAKEYSEFVKRNCLLLGLSIDSNPSHLAWIENIRRTQSVTIPFPILADRDGAIAKRYGMLAADEKNFATVRNVYIIDPDSVIRAMLIYPATNGRYIPEILRLLDALQMSTKEGVVTPANWKPGDPVLIPPPQNFDDLMKRSEDQGLNCIEWYLCYKKEAPKPKPKPRMTINIDDLRLPPGPMDV